VRLGKGGEWGGGSQKEPQDFEGTEQIIEFPPPPRQNVARDFLSRALDNVQARWRGYVVDANGLLACRDMIVTLSRTKESAFHSPKMTSSFKRADCSNDLT
jgi:hypothetical protein